MGQHLCFAAVIKSSSSTPHEPDGCYVLACCAIPADGFVSEAMSSTAKDACGIALQNGAKA